jgi:hypothetical protein
MSHATTDGVAAAGLRQCGRCRLHFPILPGTDPAELTDWWLCAACHESLVPGQKRVRKLDLPPTEPAQTDTSISG